MELYNYNTDTFYNRFGNLNITDSSFNYKINSPFIEEQLEQLKLNFKLPNFGNLESQTTRRNDDEVSLNSRILLGRNVDMNGVNAKLLHFMNVFHEEYDKYTLKPITITSGLRNPGLRVGKFYKTSKHNSGNAIDIVGNFDVIKKVVNSQRVLELALKYNIKHLDETTAETMARTGATGKHFHFQING